MSGEDELMNLLELPEIVVEKVLSYMTYEELAHLRIVCRRFNQINMALLNKGFRKVERYQAKCLREVKSMLPRRESERRNHPLFRHCDILTAIETRLSLLNMTFIKYVDCQMCCFIPGKVIDEIYRVLRFIQNNKTLPRAHEILTELRDISSMAMEHFEEKIIRTLKPTPLTSTSPRFSLPPSLSSLSPHSSPGSTSISSPLSKSFASSSSSDDIPNLIASNRYYRSCVSGLKKEVADLKLKMNEMRRKMSEQERVALEQNRILSEQTVKLTSQEGKLNEVNRKLLEYDQRFSELFMDVGRTKEDHASTSSTNTSSSNWKKEDPTKQFYVNQSLSAPALGSAVFVAANVMQPNLVPVNLATAALPTPAYLSQSHLAGFPSGSLTLSMSPAPSDISPRTISPSAGLISDQCSKKNCYSKCSSPVHELPTTSQAVDSSSTIYNHHDVAKVHRKKHRKRKLSEGEQSEEGSNVKWIKS
ncbi:hypothetical protein Pmani_008075 [Petrolisthes manimaculis]|uniref:F-box domain-containing protein n=1 Tax=Petrolisthes manimaculis TaxID=1843537 RepID=A0AAE1Q7S1_9EUCA|nr:hypothetical protein Pmani_008075 [Petrolisthes manimaculis]